MTSNNQDQIETALGLHLNLTQPFPFDIDPQPSPVMSLIAEALGLCCESLSLAGWNPILADRDRHPFFELLNVMDKGLMAYLDCQFHLL